MASVSLTRVIEKMKLENLTPETDVKHVKITQPDINRPALQLAGYFEHFDATRLQIIGFVEFGATSLIVSFPFFNCYFPTLKE